MSNTRLVDKASIFIYSETGKSKLKWAASFKDAGAFDNEGYWVVTYLGTKYQAQRIIWELFNGPIEDDLVIDHIDGDTNNNLIENLRLVTRSWNSQNQSINIKNRSGKTGVFKRVHKGYEFWVATWVDLESKKKQKNFSCSKYGDEQARELAVSFRDKKIFELNSNGQCYTTRHCGGLGLAISSGKEPL